MKIAEKIKYLNENFESLTIEDLEKELEASKSKKLTEVLRSIISTKKFQDKVTYIKENFDNLSIKDLKKELELSEEEELTRSLEALISIKEAESVDVEFISGIGRGGAREGAGRKTEEKRTVAFQLKTTPDRREELKEKILKVSRFYNYTGGDLALLHLLDKEIEENNL